MLKLHFIRPTSEMVSWDYFSFLQLLQSVLARNLSQNLPSNPVPMHGMEQEKLENDRIMDLESLLKKINVSICICTNSLTLKNKYFSIN